MNKFEAHMLAQEIVKLMPKDYSKDEILTTIQLSERTGISVTWIRRNSNKLPHFRVGTDLRYSLNEVMNFLKEQ